MLTVSLVGNNEIVADFTEAPARVQRVAVRAMNRGVLAARTYLSSNISRDIGLKVGDVKKAIPMMEATFNSPQARIAASLKKIPLIQFKARGPEPSRGLGNGVTYSIGGARRRIPNAFIARMASGHRGVFTRVGKSVRKSTGAWSKNLPIDQKHGPSLGGVFKKYRTPALQRAQEAMDKTFSRDLVYAAAKKAEWDAKFAALDGVEFDELGGS